MHVWLLPVEQRRGTNNVVNCREKSPRLFGEGEAYSSTRVKTERLGLNCDTRWLSISEDGTNIGYSNNVHFDGLEKFDHLGSSS